MSRPQGLIAWGHEHAIAERIQQHWDAGHVCVQAVQSDGKTPDQKLLQRLARLN